MGIWTQFQGHIQLNRVRLTIIAMKLELGNLSEVAPAPVVFALLASLLVATTAIVGCIIGVVAFCFRLCILIDHLHLGYLSRRRRRREAEKRAYDGWLGVSGWGLTEGPHNLRKSLRLMPTLAYDNMTYISLKYDVHKRRL